MKHVCVPAVASDCLKLTGPRCGRAFVSFKVATCFSAQRGCKEWLSESEPKQNLYAKTVYMSAGRMQDAKLLPYLKTWLHDIN